MHATALRSHEGEEVRPERRAAEELLERGELEAARHLLASLVAADPGDSRSKGLLGLCCFRLGQLDEAARIYGELVAENRTDATLRINLGLVALKRGAARDAIVQFEEAVRLAPAHRKAHNYLGLAYAQAGELARARDAFLKAGAQAMAARMEHLLAEQEKRGDTDPERAAAAAAATPPPAVPSPAEEARSDDLPTVEKFAAETALRWPSGRPFGIGPDGAAIHFETEIRTRLDGLVAVRGVAAWTPVQKRFRGAEIARPFGHGARQFWRATGGGSLLFAARDRVFTALLLEQETWIVEDRLLSFEESLSWENGRLPGQATDLHLVRLTGNGRILLATDRPVRAERVGGGCLSLPTSGLVGWKGALAPRLVAGEEGPAVPWIELSGTGIVLLLA